MLLARPLCADDPDQLALGLRRMGLPTAAVEYLLEKQPQLQVLLTGIGLTEGRFLKAHSGGDEFPAYVPGDVKRRPGTALLSGRLDQLRRLAQAATEPELAEMRAALARLWEVRPPPPLRLKNARLPLGSRTLLMGVVNVTPDSFSDGGQFLDPERAVAHGLALAQAGADLLDVGGESTRPGARPVSATEELERVLPVLRGLAGAGVPLSIDTAKAEVAQAALAAGASLVNDVTALGDPRMAWVVSDAGAALCLMHMRGTPGSMQDDPRYDDVVAEVLEALAAAVGRATAAGIARDQLLVDPGIGFGKTVEHNLLLLKRVGDLRQLGVGVLVGTSRKSFLGKLTGGRPAAERQAATLGSLAVLAASGGVDILRVHDVAAARDAVAVADAIRRAAGA